MLRFLLLPLLVACAGTEGQQGLQGEAGAQGERGEQGATGPAGSSCWDLNQDGQNDTEEDLNADGAWSTADCQGAVSAGPSKGDVYVVTADVEQDPYEVTAWCSDADDILLAGGCTGMEDSGVAFSPQFSFAPVQADDLTAPAGYWCWWSQATGTSYRITATATCLTIEGE